MSVKTLTKPLDLLKPLRKWYNFILEKLPVELEYEDDIFKKYDIYGYIETCYEIFHTQGDEASFKDIEKYLENLGCKK